LLVTIGVLMVAVAGCTSRFASDSAATEGEPVAAAATSDASTAQAADAADSATATVIARSLRVRGAPDADAAVVYGIREGEQYKVIALSSDGAWVQLSIPKAPEGAGWVNANFVSVEGSITDAAVVEPAAAVVEPTAAPAAAVTPVVAATPTGKSTADTAANAAVKPGAGGIAVVNGEGLRLRVRATPNTTGDIVGYAYDGERFAVLETSASGAWVRIGGRIDTDNPDGGWVAAEFVVIEE
jgi:uncharacterized protein YgiM (DUF1202 family)